MIESTFFFMHTIWFSGVDIHTLDKDVSFADVNFVPLPETLRMDSMWGGGGPFTPYNVNMTLDTSSWVSYGPLVGENASTGKEEFLGF